MFTAFTNKQNICQSSFIIGVALKDLEEISPSLEDILYLKAHKKENYKQVEFVITLQHILRDTNNRSNFSNKHLHQDFFTEDLKSMYLPDMYTEYVFT